ncbi:MAG: hypothetical protein ACPGO3_02115 [Magnetospiraceae bacterium]
MALALVFLEIAMKIFWVGLALGIYLIGLVGHVILEQYGSPFLWFYYLFVN